jgi:hypothetical protein
MRIGVPISLGDDRVYSLLTALAAFVIRAVFQNERAV